MPNPYDPQNPAKPNYFGGRVKQLEAGRDRILRARQQQQSGGVLIFGHRGVGKTSLLDKIIDMAQRVNDEPSNTLVIKRRLSNRTSSDELYKILNEELLTQISLRRNLVERLRGQLSRVENVRVFELELGLTQSGERTSYNLWKNSISNVRNADFILIAIDDADQLLPETLGELKTIMEDSRTVPILLVISGGVAFEKQLVDDYSPISRIFSGASFNLGKFDLNETTEVLTIPLIYNENTNWENQAINELQTLTSGYPFLVQCLASACYRENQTITREGVLQSVNRAIEIGRSWLDHEIPHASEQDIISFAKLIRINKEFIKSSDMNKLGIPSPYIGRLVKLGIIEQVRRGRYSLKKSPMIAIYEMLKRGLTLE